MELVFLGFILRPWRKGTEYKLPHFSNLERKMATISSFPPTVHYFVFVYDFKFKYKKIRLEFMGATWRNVEKVKWLESFCKAL